MENVIVQYENSNLNISVPDKIIWPGKFTHIESLSLSQSVKYCFLKYVMTLKA